MEIAAWLGAGGAHQRDRPMPRTRRVIQINPWQFSQVGRLESIAGETLRPGRRCRPPLAKPCSKTLNGGDEAIAVGASMNSLRLLGRAVAGADRGALEAPSIDASFADGGSVVTAPAGPPPVVVALMDLGPPTRDRRVAAIERSSGRPQACASASRKGLGNHRLVDRDRAERPAAGPPSRLELALRSLDRPFRGARCGGGLRSRRARHRHRET